MPRLCVLLALIGLLAVGCPWPEPYKYTSADNDSYRDGGLLDSAGGDADEANDQDREVVDPDVIRRDGSTLYVLNQYRGLTLVDLDSHAILAQLPTYGFPRDLYLVGDRAYVLVANALDYSTDGSVISYSVRACLYVVDVANPQEAQIISSFDFWGDLVDSRLVGDVLYAVCAQYEWQWEGAELEKVQTSESWVTSVNVADPNDIYEADEVSFEGAGNVIQVTPTAIFVVGHRWSWETRNDWSTVTYVDITDPAGAMAVRGQADIRGRVADRFKMDARDGVLRVVSNAWEDQRQVYITTIDLADPDALEVLAETRLERASGETLFATRFDGDKAYIVTFLVKDPLFVIDLADPANPVVAGMLEVPGWSTHIESRGDRLIALGVDDTDGRKVSVSLFDVADPAAPALIDRVSFGESWAWSSAYEDVDAFSVFDDLLIVPFSGWCRDFGGYDRLQFISWASDDLVLRGAVDLDGSILRSFEYFDTYYGVTSEQLAAIDTTDLDNPVVSKSVVLAENVTDFIELSPTLGAEIVSRCDTGITTLRTTALGAKGLGEVDVEIGQLANAFARGSQVVLVGTVWAEEPGYRVVSIDCSTPSSPQAGEVLSIDVPPYSACWPIYRGGMYVDAAEGGKSIWMPYPRYARENAFLVDGILALRCTGDEYDTVLGGAEPYQGLALVNLDLPGIVSTVGLGYERVISVNGGADRLYIGTLESAGQDSVTAHPLCAHFIMAFDPRTLEAGPQANVPGTFVQYDAEEDLLVLQDKQWGPKAHVNGETRTQLRTVRWDGAGQAEPLAAADLPESIGRVLGRGSKVFLETYDGGCRLNAASIADSGAIALGSETLVTKQWASLLDAHGDDAFVTVGGGAVARYHFGPEGNLADLVEVMGTPLKMRFGETAAYIPLGYFGLVTML